MASKKIDLKKYFKKRSLMRLFLVILGSFILAFGTTVFLTPANVVSGGTSGIAIIINYYLEPIFETNFVDIFIWIFNVVLFVFSFIFLGKEFTIKSMVSTFVFPAFVTLITRTGMFNFISKYFTPTETEFFEGNLSYLLAGIFGGLSVGLGVGVSFIGGGSTGGLDILCFIVNKYSHIKVSILSFAFDFTIILTSAFVIQDNLIRAFIGAIGALLAAGVIELIYAKRTNSYIVEIISKEYGKIVDYIIKELDQTATIIDAKGAFTNDEYKLIRFIVSQSNYNLIKDRIAEIDNKAFVSVISTNQVLGEGFTPIKVKKKKEHE